MSVLNAEQLKAIPYAEKVHLMEIVMQSISQDLATQPISEDLKQELRRRLEEHRLHPELSEPWEHVLAEIERQLA
jgi:putative addiction module component (TIGR02574 family)